MFDLSHLRSFIAVAEEMHFGRAAGRLNLTQSPLSRQVQLLEQSLGVTLLERTTRTVRLTSAGRTFLAEAHRVLETAERAQQLTRRVAKGEAGVVTLGFTSSSAYRTLPQIVSLIRTALPGLDLILEEMVTVGQIEALAARRIDLGLLRPPRMALDDGLRITLAPLLREQLLLAAPLGHALATGRQPSLRDLDQQPFITWAPGGGSYFVDLLTDLFRNSGIVPHIVQRVNQTHTMLALVGAGMGLALVPDAARSIHMAGVVLRPIELPDATSTELLLAWRNDNDNPALPALRALVLEAFADGESRSS
jgi:DNA-binding transcriptional LysR family regulator